MLRRTRWWRWFDQSELHFKIYCRLTSRKLWFYLITLYPVNTAHNDPLYELPSKVDVRMFSAQKVSSQNPIIITCGQPLFTFHHSCFRYVNKWMVTSLNLFQEHSHNQQFHQYNRSCSSMTGFWWLILAYVFFRIYLYSITQQALVDTVAIVKQKLHSLALKNVLKTTSVITFSS